MKRMHNLACLLLALGLQMAAILGMIGRYEWICRKGEEVRIPCQAYDPLDPFRGRYLRMSVRERYSDSQEGGYPPMGYTGKGSRAPYARFAPGERQENGKVLHHIVEVAQEPSQEGLWMQCLQCYLDFHVADPARPEKKTALVLEFPHQFFLPEKYASRAEKLLAENPDDGVAVYRVWRGKGVLVDVEVKGISLLSQLKTP